MKNLEEFFINTSQISGIVDFINWLNRENFHPSSDDDVTWIHVGSNGAEEYQPFELLKKYEEYRIQDYEDRMREAEDETII